MRAAPHAEDTAQAVDQVVRTILMGKLYYRCEFLTDLLADLSEELARDCRLNDAALALVAYRQWGLKGLKRLEGDFALVIWDAHKKCLVGSRDPMGAILFSG